jgi:peroxiredoxin
MASLITKRLSLLNFAKKSLIQTSRPSLSTSNCLFQKAKVQHAAPDFKGQAVVNGQFKEISLSDYKGKWLVLFFYPLDFTFVCPTEIIAFSDHIDKFKNINCEVVYPDTKTLFCNNLN